ncbi:MAG: SRPBCC domain-containing protein [Pseudomonadota bacterium]
MSFNLDFEKHYPHPPERVWQALVSPDSLARWLMPNDFEPIIGRVSKFRFPRGDCDGEEGIVLVEVEEIERPECMVWLWRNTDQDETTRVTFTLKPSNGGTLLRLNHRDITTEAEAASLGGGWPGKLASLQELLGP